MEETLVRKRRKELGMTQEKVALGVGVSLVSVRLWERGVAKPKEDNADKLAEFLLSTVEELGLGVDKEGSLGVE